VVEEKAMDGAISAFDEGVGEAPYIEALHPFFAMISASEEFNACVGVVGIELSDLWGISISSLNNL
jgi:hypothetical protein